ncbi:MAG: Uma2 family endonuclease [Spirochaetales bacterium]|nr:Uma2 family endonuclease [Spirochaetales bacterium]
MALTKVKLTYRDFILFPDNGKRHELIDGDHFITPAPSIRHQIVSKNIEYLFERYFRNSDTGIILDAPVDVYLSDFDIVEPDLIIIKKENQKIIRDNYIKGHPDMVVEIISPSTQKNDIELKKHLYEKYGVEEYWIVDPDNNEVQQYVLREGTYMKRGTFTDGITAHILPDLSIDLKKIF